MVGPARAGYDRPVCEHKFVRWDNLKVDGDFHLLEVLARIPEPFDPAERWAIA